MAPPTSKPPQKRKHQSIFKPPRPAPSKASKQTSKPTRWKSAPAKTKAKHTSYIASQASASEDDDDDDEMDLEKHAVSSDENSDLISATPPRDASRSPPSHSQASGQPPTIPPALLNTLLHHNFKSPDSRIGKEAMGVVGKYVETFVREAIARAAWERGLVEKEGRGAGPEVEFLEVEDLEKLAPQLVLDF
ncbi:hypothetical protein MMC21_007932 [Puttea exsequens]|nr:hypothetical protein [Puttea exsequens]